MRLRKVKQVTWQPEVGEEIWYQYALSMDKGRVLARKGDQYVVDRKGQKIIRTRNELWPKETMAHVGDFPPGWEHE